MIIDALIAIVLYIFCFNNLKNHFKGEEELFKIKFKHLIDSFESNLFSSDSLQTTQNEKSKKEEHKFMASDLDKNKMSHKYSQNYDEFEDNEDDNKSGKTKNIPPIILKIWGQISEDKYQKLRNNSSWLNLTTKVCTNCFLNFTQMLLLYYFIS